MADGEKGERGVDITSQPSADERDGLGVNKGSEDARAIRVILGEAVVVRT